MTEVLSLIVSEITCHLGSRCCLSSQTELEILQNPEHNQHGKQRLMKHPCQTNPKISEGSCGAGTGIISTQPMHAKSEVLREVQTHISSDTVCY